MCEASKKRSLHRDWDIPVLLRSFRESALHYLWLWVELFHQWAEKKRSASVRQAHSTTCRKAPEQCSCLSQERILFYEEKKSASRAEQKGSHFEFETYKFVTSKGVALVLPKLTIFATPWSKTGLRAEHCLLKRSLSKSFFSFSSLQAKFMFGRSCTPVVAAKCRMECAVQLRTDRTRLFSADLRSAIFRKCESRNMPMSNWTFLLTVAAAKEPFLYSGHQFYEENSGVTACRRTWLRMTASNPTFKTFKASRRWLRCLNMGLGFSLDSCMVCDERCVFSKLRSREKSKFVLGDVEVFVRKLIF